MNILVFTSSMIDSHFASYQNSANIKPNPSNQNFYTKLIKALSLKNNVSVISHRPFTKGMFKEKKLESEFNMSGKVAYYYTQIEASKTYKLLYEKKEIMKAAELAINDFHSPDFVIITDTLRLNLIRAAQKIAKLHKVKIIGMLTDNPDNLSSVNPAYSLDIKKHVQKLDGYLSLSEGLVNVFDTNKPSYIFEGLAAEEEIPQKEPIYDYFFFSGSLYERYGVKNLVEAFCASNIKSKLVIAGSGPLAKEIDRLSEKDYRILYLTQLPKSRIVSYQKNAIANINPRPIDSKLDKESIPSKIFEYLASGVPTISTKFEKLYLPFKDDIYWIEDNSVEAIKTALENFDKSPIEEKKKKAMNAKNKVFEFYGLDVQGESISHFITELISLKSN